MSVLKYFRTCQLVCKIIPNTVYYIILHNWDSIIFFKNSVFSCNLNFWFFLHTCIYVHVVVYCSYTKIRKLDLLPKAFDPPIHPPTPQSAHASWPWLLIYICDENKCLFQWSKELASFSTSIHWSVLIIFFNINLLVKLRCMWYKIACRPCEWSWKLQTELKNIDFERTLKCNL